MSLKNLVTQPEIDPRTFRLVAQRLNHYATPDPNETLVHFEVNLTKLATCILNVDSLKTASVPRELEAEISFIFIFS